MFDPPDIPRQRPAAPAPAPGDRRRILNEVTDALERSDVVSDPTSRRVFLRELELAIGQRVLNQELSQGRTQLIALARVCLEKAAGLRSLAECLQLLEPQSESVATLLRLADEWQAIQQFAAHDLNWLRLDLSTTTITHEARLLVTQHQDSPFPAHCASAWDLFTHLATVNSAVGFPLWLRLLEHLAPSVQPTSRSKLRDLLGVLNREWSSIPHGQPEHTSNVEQTPGLASTAYLVIQFEKYGPEQDTFILSHWYQWASPRWQPVRGEDRHVQRAELEAAVDGIVLATERRWAALSGPVTIEFVLPWQLLNEPVDMWRKELDSPEPSPLTTEYPLVIRSLDRIRADHWHRAWRGRWETLAEGPAQGDPVYCAADDQDSFQLEATLKRLQGTVVLVLTEPPLPDSAGERQLRSGVRSGIPAIVWHRRQAVSDLCRIVNSAVLSHQATLDVARLPRRVSELRQQAWSEDPRMEVGHPGHGFVILWDDPVRQPGRAGSASSDAGKVRA